jgi:predicted amidohydrolase YtcJ
MRNNILLLLCLFLYACSGKQRADIIVHNAVVYTVDGNFSTVEAFAVKDGKILAAGTSKDILGNYEAEEKVDAAGKPVYPGFIDAHCHFYGYGQTLYTVNLVGTKSFDEVVERVVEFSKTHKGEWILGRGWDQNDWAVKEFPNKAKLDSLFPERPVFLQRIDGHAAIANSEALKRAGITNTTKIPGGEVELEHSKSLWIENLATGEIIRPAYDPPLTGVLIDNAVSLVDSVVPKPTTEEMTAFLVDAQKNCLAAGLTTVDDAGLEKKVIDLIDTLQRQGKLKMRVYAMLTDNKENLDHYLRSGPYKTERLNVRSFKFYADGALGSRGACLLHPYHDKPGNVGFLLSAPEYFRSSVDLMLKHGFQMNTHCIGDSATRLILSIGSEKLDLDKHRWRIEHAQVVSAIDLDHFKKFIPSVQPTHATSDMYWAKDRLGPERVKTAYAYKDLLKASGLVALGTDFPVENINPMYTFYASIARKDLKGWPASGFQVENALTREETLKGMTIWAAYSNFEENEKGSIEPGKLADFVILDEDIMKIEPDKIPYVKVAATYIGGEKVYSK